MKKLYLFILATAVTFAAAVSCSKEADDPTQPSEQQEEEQTVPQDNEDETLPEGKIRLDFSVSSEATKTIWDGTTHAWADGDQIRIIWGEGSEGYVDAEVKDGKVSAEVSDAEYYYAVYPKTATYALDLANGKVTITIPRYQTGAFADANIMAAKTAKADANLEFKNMTSIIKFTTGSTYSYNSVSFMANDQTKLTGTVATTFPDEFDVETANGSESIVCIQKGNPSGNAGVSASKTYYLAMLPGAEITNGIGFKIEQRDSETDLLGGAISKSAFARERSKIYDMGTLDSRIIKDWYISESGTGAGNDPMAPAGPARLMDLLNPAYSTNNTTAGWRLTGAIVHVAGGTYNLQELNGGEVFDPHYNLSNFVAHIKGEGDALNPTKFICNQTAATDHIIEISGSNKVGDFTFENITFTANPAASETNIDGVALSFTSSVASQLTFKDCVFTGITGSTGTANFNGGAAVNFNSEAAATILFDGCTFSNNTAARGGAVAFHNTDVNSDIQFKNCVFSNNIANSNQGGSVYVYANAAPVVFDGTSFTGDGSTNNAVNGAAMCVIANGAVTIQNGCSFSNLVTTGNGGAIFNHGTVVIDNSSISNCKAKQGGAIYTDGNLTIRNNSTISGNAMYNGGTNGGGIYAIYGTSGSDAPTVDIENSSIVYNSSTNGAAIYGGKGNASHFVVTRVFNTLFKSNAASGGAASGANRNGGCVYATDYNYLLFANCTFSDNTVGTGGIISMGRSGSVDYNKLYLVSSTIDGANDGIQRNSKVNVVYNSIVIGNKTNNTQNLSINHSIWGVSSQLNIYGASVLQGNGNYTNTATSENITFALGSYSDGVYPLVDSYSSLYNQGMSTSEIQALSFDNISLTDAQLALLAKDQKGNDRTGTIMGAYVLTE